MSLTESMVNESLKKLIDPNTEKSLVDTKSIESIDIVDEKPNLKICLFFFNLRNMSSHNSLFFSEFVEE